MSLNSIVYKITIEDVRYGVDFLPYTNSTHGINAGTFILDTRESLLSGFENHKSSINSSIGGNLSSNYSFGFNIINENFANDIVDDGVFFKNLLCTIEISKDGGSVFNKDWVGIVDTITVSYIEVKFKCIERTKQLIKTIGSDKVPICLGSNYFCKLTEDQTEEEFIETRFILSSENSVYRYFHKVFGLNSNEKKITLFLSDVADSSYALQALIDGEELFVEVVAGDGVGSFLKIISFTNTKVTSLNTVDLYLDDVSGISEISSENESIYRIVKLRKRYVLSKNQVVTHTNNNNIYEKTLTFYDNEKPYTISESAYSVFSTSNYYGIECDRVYKDNQISAYNSIPLNPINKKVSEGIIGYEKLSFGVSCNFSVSEMEEIFSKIDDEYYFSIEGFTLPDCFSGVEDQKKGCYKYSLYLKANVNNSVSSGKPINIVEESSPYNVTGVPIQGFPSVDIFRSGNDLIVEFNDVNVRNFDYNIINKMIHTTEFIESYTLSIRIDAKIITSDIFAPTTVDFKGLSLRERNNITYDNISLGVYGEDIVKYSVDGKVDNTIKYLLTEYMGVNPVDINDTSFLLAVSNYSNYPVAYKMNPAHQITSQVDAIELIRSILNDYHISLYIGRDGRYTLKNWLWQSYLLNQNSTVDYSFSESNTISIGEIKRDNINPICSDIELKFNLKEFKDEFDNVIRIKGTNDSVFDFEKHTEGIERSDYATAKSAWSLLRSGYKRIRSQSQTKEESRWYKTRFSNNTGYNEAVNSLRNRLVHTTREHEYIEFSTSFDYLDVDLLSFVNIREPKITDGNYRNGWIVERTVDNKNFIIKFKMLLDVNIYDPFIEVITVINDNSLLGDTYIDNSITGDTIQDGDGIQ